MKIRDPAATYPIFVGVTVIGMWTSFYFANAIPELEPEPIHTIPHITAGLPLVFPP